MQLLKLYLGALLFSFRTQAVVEALFSFIFFLATPGMYKVKYFTFPLLLKDNNWTLLYRWLRSLRNLSAGAAHMI